MVYKNEKDAITEFYKNCPKGYHVDHIFPLSGKLISGFHCLSNLQYLPATDNLRKRNKFTLQEKGHPPKLSNIQMHFPRKYLTS